MYNADNCVPIENKTAKKSKHCNEQSSKNHNVLKCGLYK